MRSFSDFNKHLISFSAWSRKNTSWVATTLWVEGCQLLAIFGKFVFFSIIIDTLKYKGKSNKQREERKWRWGWLWQGEESRLSRTSSETWVRSATNLWIYRFMSHFNILWGLNVFCCKQTNDLLFGKSPERKVNDQNASILTKSNMHPCFAYANHQG